MYKPFHPRDKLNQGSETHFKIGELTYKLFDVGGQRSERRKWLNIFDSVTALVFLIAINECERICDL
jgi:guanine nucleotide-binding protein G(i) subunit alpha